MAATGWMTGALVGAALFAAQPGGVNEVTGVLVDVSQDDDGTVTVVLAVGEDQELTLVAGPDAELSSEGEAITVEELADALGATATARYRETAGDMLLASLELAWPDPEGE